MSTLPHVRRHDAASDQKEKAPLIVRALGSGGGGGGGGGSRTSVSERSFLAALTIASLATAILSTTFDLFYVETFLSAYELPLSSYALGTFVYTIIDSANDFGGAWFVDAFALRASGRGAVVRRTGCIFALCFLTPFFRGRRVKASPFLSTAHFITSLSLYDTMFTFCTMLFGSMFTDNHSLSESTRIHFMASGKVVNLVGSFLVGRIGLSLFDTDNMWGFRVHVIMLCCLSCGLFLIAQRLMQRTGKDHDRGKPTKKLCLWRVVNDLSGHINFRAWIAMESLLECQVNFSATFMKTFVDRLLIEQGMSEESADWLLASIGPASQVLGIFIFMPIRKIGYRKIYTWLFQAKIVLSLFLAAFGSPQSTNMITFFLVVNQITTAAVQTSGFYLAMSDLVAELKYEQAKAGRLDEPSYAGLLFGANSLFCKPVGAILPIVAAWSLARVGYSTGTHTRFFTIHKETPDEREVRQVLFNLLVIPPLLFSTFQLWFWRRYNLGADRAEEVRLELRRLKTAERSDSSEANP